MNYEADKASEKPIARGVRTGLADTSMQSDDTGATTAAETPAGLVEEIKACYQDQGYLPIFRVTQIVRYHEARWQADRQALAEAVEKKDRLLGYLVLATGEQTWAGAAAWISKADADRARLEARIKELEAEVARLTDELESSRMLQDPEGWKV